jgi:hypothetical protein
MALLNFGASVNDMRRSVGSTVYARNRGGAYARNRTFPTQPNTELQTAQRTRFTTISEAWKTRTEAQRKSWIIAAPEFPYIDVYGNQKTLSGFGLFQKLNTNLLVAGQLAISTAPLHQQFNKLISVTVTADVSASEVFLNLDAETYESGYEAIICATPLLSPGIYFAKKYFRIIDTVALSDLSSPVNFYTQWIAAFGTLTAAFKIFMKVYVIAHNSGQSGVPQQGSTIVIA